MAYRAERAEWQASPSCRRTCGGRVRRGRQQPIYVSWNGATDVEGWLIEAGPSEGELTELATVDKTGFETAARVAAPEDDTVYRVTALDASGEPLGEPRTLTP